MVAGSCGIVLFLILPLLSIFFSIVSESIRGNLREKAIFVTLIKGKLSGKKSDFSTCNHHQAILNAQARVNVVGWQARQFFQSLKCFGDS
jgi:hypothetical protein